MGINDRRVGGLYEYGGLAINFGVVGYLGRE